MRFFIPELKISNLLILGVVFLGISTMGAGIGTECWSDYPNVGGSPQPIPGFAVASDFSSRKCEQNQTVCQNSGGISKAGFGCDAGLVCCLRPATSWACYNNYVGDDRSTFKETKCVAAADCKSPDKSLGTGFGCSGAQNTCCAVIEPTGSAAQTKEVPKTGSTAAWDLGGRSGGLRLVSCTETGNCTIQDIVQQGIYFADFLIGLSGALFLIAFVWGGALYLLSFGRQDWVSKGRDAMVKSAIGIVFIILAWTIVTYVAASLGYTKF